MRWSCGRDDRAARVTERREPGQRLGWQRVGMAMNELPHATFAPEVSIGSPMAPETV